MRFPLILVADNIRSLYNVGSLFRIADAVDALEVLLVGISGYPDMGNSDPRRPYLREKVHAAIQKTALSGIEMPFKYFEHRQDCIAYLKAINTFIICLEQTENSISIFNQFQIKKPCALILGHEVDGVHQDLLKQADLLLEIPMYGKGISLNVATSGAVAAYALIEKFKS